MVAVTLRILIVFLRELIGCGGTQNCRVAQVALVVVAVVLWMCDGARRAVARVCDAITFVRTKVVA